jgi:hypothetical protein
MFGCLSRLVRIPFCIVTRCKLGLVNELSDKPGSRDTSSIYAAIPGRAADPVRATALTGRRLFHVLGKRRSRHSPGAADLPLPDANRQTGQEMSECPLMSAVWCRHV